MGTEKIELVLHREIRLKLTALVSGLLKVNELDRWIKRVDIYLVDHQNGVSDFTFNELLVIRYNHVTGLVEIRVNPLKYFYKFVGTSKELPLFMERFEAFIDELKANLRADLSKEMGLRLAKQVLIAKVYERLSLEFSKILFSFLRGRIIIEDCLTEVYIQSDVVTSSISFALSDGNDLLREIRIKNHSEPNKEMEALVDYLQGCLLTVPFKAGVDIDEESRAMALIPQRMSPGYSAPSKLIYSMLKNAEINPIIDVLYTSVYETKSFRFGEASISLSYYKCEQGYYILDFDTQMVVMRSYLKDLMVYVLSLWDPEDFEM
ncbi:hypothetical protein [Bacillus toyonensis]|uniref:hypothetical protein n=1 Tax=Bacillus toyonensis TaxID=155322 RepID=UPI002E1C8ABD|nr:hypothetical protein [Bacillus toyonensis]